MVAEQRISVALLADPGQVAPAELWLSLVRVARTIKTKAQQAVSCAGLILAFGGEPEPHACRFRWRTDGNTREARSAAIHAASSILWPNAKAAKRL